MTNTKPSPAELFENITGWEELAIERSFGKPVDKLAEGNQMTLIRALVFLLKKRDDGLNDSEAKKAAMDMPFKECQELFDLSEETDDVGDPSPLGNDA